MEITKEEFQTLWNICRSWQSDPIRASNGTPEDLKKYMRIFLKLEEMGLVKIEIRDNQIYGAIGTKEGYEILDDKKYDEMGWVED